MKSLKSLLIVLVAIVAVVLFVSSRSVYATGGIVLNPGATSNNTVKNNTVKNEAKVNKVNKVNNTVVVNNINNDLPKTGENDTYVIAGVGAVALAIGVISFIKARNI